jgi:hypothetical protein
MDSDEDEEQYDKKGGEAIDIGEDFGSEEEGDEDDDDDDDQIGLQAQ